MKLKEEYQKAIKAIDAWEIDKAIKIIEGCSDHDDELDLIIELLIDEDSMEVEEARSMLEEKISELE